jgi:peptide deformylase
MSVRTVLRAGDPRLRQPAAEVTAFNEPWLRELVTDLIDTMHAFDGAGLAATQIGEPWRVVVFGFEANPRYPQAESVPFTVLVNPVITALDDEMEEDWEGCLSVPGLRGRVSRHARIRYRGFDPTGVAIDRTVSGFHARVVQHECDHLDGILYPQRMHDLSTLGFLEELRASGAMPVPGADDPPRSPTASADTAS